MPRDPHFDNLLAVLEDEIRRKTDEYGITPEKAFSRVAAEWLGYDLDPGSFIDQKDRGIDFWTQTDSGFNIFQVKSHEFKTGALQSDKRFDHQGILDLQRVEKYLLSPAGAERNSLLKHFRHRWEHMIESKRFEKSEDAIEVNLGLVLLGSGLTDDAISEWNSLEESFRDEKQFHGVSIKFSATLYTITDLLAARWRLDNREWKDSKGQNRDYIELRPADIKQILEDHNTSVFYCHASDLVRAYSEFGYQLFEPNVRCNIAVSKVNEAIRTTVKKRAGREEFRFLNNGVTVVCKNYKKPSDNKPFFRVIQPGIVNGLQTVCALHDACKSLKSDERDHFDRRCFVLVRLLQENSLTDVSRLVRATNTQNPMQARNLYSNTSEQILFERLFAEMGWFYERKQNAWEAFAADPKRWRSLPNKTKGEFQIRNNGRPKPRRADNEDLAQSWLAFVGFAEEANHARRQIFENETWYEFVFLHSSKKHGAEYGYKLQEAQADSVESAPRPDIMLAAFLMREFAKAVTPNPKQNKNAAIERMNLNASLPKDELETRLAKDHEYVKWQVISGMSLLFVEFCGYVLFSAFSNDLRQPAGAILQNGSLHQLQTSLAYEEVADRVAQSSFEEDDILPTMWHLFIYAVDELVGSGWMDGYRQATSRNRYTYSSDTRKRLHKTVQDVHQYTVKRQLIKPWASGIKVGPGLFGFIRDVLTQRS